MSSVLKTNGIFLTYSQQNEVLSTVCYVGNCEGNNIKTGGAKVSNFKPRGAEGSNIRPRGARRSDIKNRVAGEEATSNPVELIERFLDLNYHPSNTHVSSNINECRRSCNEADHSRNKPPQFQYYNNGKNKASYV